MENLSQLMAGFASALTLYKLGYCFFGVLMGMLMGVLPGVGAMATIAMLLPITFYVPPDSGLIMLAGIYYGAQYGGSVSSILLNLPGTPSSAIVALDGYPMKQQGRAGPAIFLTTIASFIGSLIAIVLLISAAPAVARLALTFGSADYFSLMVVGLVAAASLTRFGIARGLSMSILGLTLGLIGTDVATGTYRYTFNNMELADGLSVVAMAMGLFGVSEIIHMVSSRSARNGAVPSVSFRDLLPTKSDLKQSRAPIIRGGLLGAVVGALPGTGASIGAFMAYGVEKRISREPHKFGTGHVPGIVAPEAANNSAAQASFIPTLTLGVPGDPVLALMMTALIIHGVQPGPTMIVEHPDIYWGLVASFIIGNVLLLILNLPLIGIWVRLLQVSYRLLFPVIIALICIGVFAVGNSAFQVMQVVVFGIIGYLMRFARLEPAPVLLGFVLGPMVEENFRRALQLSRGDMLVFFERPASALMLGFALLIILFSLWTSRKSLAGTKA